MIVAFTLYRIAILGALSIHTACAQARFESVAITLTRNQCVSHFRVIESAADRHRTERTLKVPEVVKTEISLVTIVQVSTTTVTEVVRATETLRGKCDAAPVKLPAFGCDDSYSNRKDSHQLKIHSPSLWEMLLDQDVL